MKKVKQQTHKDITAEENVFSYPDENDNEKRIAFQEVCGFTIYTIPGTEFLLNDVEFNIGMTGVYNLNENLSRPSLIFPVVPDYLIIDYVYEDGKNNEENI